ncbi:MAG: hypothetical protein GXP62_03645 [Oligoflexia bacterium]|nr:hypothetical protein [Oligoflexia bacterium]
MSNGARSTLGLLLLAGVLGGLAHRVQVAVDVLRRAGVTGTAARVMPNPAMLRAASMGQPTVVADFLWVRVALNFAEIADHPTADGSHWLQLMIRGILALDPSWRTPYFYGGSMMRVLDNIDGSDEIFAAGAAAFPDDPYFPFSLGMNAYLYRQDATEAARLLSVAAKRPGAPPWYRSAAAGFLNEHGQRGAALAYLRRQLQTENEPAVRASLSKKYKRVLHDELSARLTDRKAAWEAKSGEPLQSVQALGELPEDPMGAGWIIAPDGVVRSKKVETTLAADLRNDERLMLTSLR